MFANKFTIPQYCPQKSSSNLMSQNLHCRKLPILGRRESGPPPWLQQLAGVPNEGAVFVPLFLFQNPPPPIAARDLDDVNFDPELTDFAGEMERLNLGQPFPPNLLIECNSTCPPLENSSLAVHAPLPLPNASNRKDYPRTTTTTIMGCKLNSEIGKVYNFPMEEQQRQFSNQFLPADKVLAKIHFECYQAGSPLYLPDRIIGILQEANWTYAGFHLGSPYITKRESLLKRIEKTVGATHRIYCVDLGAHLQGNAFTRKGNLKGNLTSCTSFDIIWTAIDDWPGLFLESPSFLKVMSQTSPDYGPSISTTDSPFLNSRCDI
ncbi:unnamed protein product [Cylindrotheca closterium]|uniref:Uncharacterized protein n=1 Tax=Cylindrotheca closterium TaxID=2856 RepID=A0AAD2FIX7_9STRA|nr:unnamed protein product [Cylindrotheca closterium]